MPDTPATGFLTDEARTLTVVFEGKPIRPVKQKDKTPEHILAWMIRHREACGTPLPDGYIPPPGIDIDALLKQLPPYPPPPRSA